MTTRSKDREYIYKVIDGERYYQDQRWNEDTTKSGGQHSASAWLTFIRYYLRVAEEKASTLPEPEATTEVMDNLRKITAMCVAAMEQHDCVPRTRDTGSSKD